MNKEKKKELLDFLETDPLYLDALSLIPKEEEKKRVKAFTEEVFIKFLEVLTKAYEIDLNEK